MAMLKDPAMMFYPADFMLETSLMTDAEIGKYIKVLCNLHSHGHLSTEMIENVCGGHTSSVFDKLVKDEKGLYYHLRMEHEIEKRKTYKSGRLNNLAGKGSKKKSTYDNDSSFDAEDFYQAALKRSEEYYKNMEKK